MKIYALWHHDKDDPRSWFISSIAWREVALMNDCTQAYSINEAAPYFKPDPEIISYLLDKFDIPKDHQTEIEI